MNFGELIIIEVNSKPIDSLRQCSDLAQIAVRRFLSGEIAYWRDLNKSIKCNRYCILQ